MNNDKIKNIVDVLFFKPQSILGEKKPQEVEDFHLIGVKLLSSTQNKKIGAKLNPILIKVGFTNVPQCILDLNINELSQIIFNLREFDTLIGDWTIVHDIPIMKTSDKKGIWRVSAQISPINCLQVSLEKTLEIPSRDVLVIDCEGVGMFM